MAWYRICLQCRRPGFNCWVWKICWRREWLPTPLFLSGEFHGQKSLAGCSPWGHKELDSTERLTLSLFFTFKIVLRTRGMLIFHVPTQLLSKCYFPLFFKPFVKIMPLSFIQDCQRSDNIPFGD